MTLDPRVTGVRGYWISQSSWQSYSSQFESIMFAFGSYINVPLGFLISLAWTPYSTFNRRNMRLKSSKTSLAFFEIVCLGANLNYRR